tara:strand:+ start:284 stop:487 length:204 start_codon:yes stop_codon:yes gene_type:complete
MINENCFLCGNKSGYDKESLKSCTYTINGSNFIICILCSDDFVKQLFKNVEDFKIWYDERLEDELEV